MEFAAPNAGAQAKGRRRGGRSGSAYVNGHNSADEGRELRRFDHVREDRGRRGNKKPHGGLTVSGEAAARQSQKPFKQRTQKGPKPLPDGNPAAFRSWYVPDGVALEPFARWLAGGAGNNALTRLANYEDANGQYFYGTGLVKNSANAYGLGLWGGSGNVQPWNGTEGTPAHLFVGSNGYVGIGTTAPAYPLDVNGQVRATNVAVTSDARFKQNIRPLGAALAAVQALRGVRYYWRRAEFPQKHFTDQEQLGFLAQEVEKVLPQAVQQDAQGYYAVDYQKVIPLLVEAIKELSAKLDAAQAANADLRQQAAATAALEARVRALEASLSGPAQR